MKSCVVFLCNPELQNLQKLQLNKFTETKCKSPQPMFSRKQVLTDRFSMLYLLLNK